MDPKRELSPEELRRLLDTARAKEQPFHGLSGQELQQFIPELKSAKETCPVSNEFLRQLQPIPCAATEVYVAISEFLHNFGMCLASRNFWPVLQQRHARLIGLANAAKLPSPPPLDRLAKCFSWNAPGGGLVVVDHATRCECFEELYGLRTAAKAAAEGLALDAKLHHGPNLASSYDTLERELNRTNISPTAPSSASAHQSAEKPAEKLTTREAAERLERLRSQGEPFTSQGKLAKLIGCAAATINKAIHTSPQLELWAKRPDAKPRAQSLTPVVTDQKSQSREPDPLDEAAIREYLENASKEERAFFNGMSPTDQIDFLNDPDRLDKRGRLLGRKP